MSRLVATSRGQDHKAVFRAVALASTTLALGVFGYIALLENHSRAYMELPVLTGPAPAPARVHVVPPAPSPATEPQPSSALTLPPTIIRATPPTGLAPGSSLLPERVQGSSTPAEHGLEPCSEWRTLGPDFVIDGQAIGAHRVRQLC